MSAHRQPTHVGNRVFWVIMLAVLLMAVAGVILGLTGSNL